MAVHVDERGFPAGGVVYRGEKATLLKRVAVIVSWEISYSLYLVHQIAGYWVIRKLENVGSGPNVAVLVAIMAAIAAAACVRRLVEIPAQKGIRGWYRGLPSRAALREERLQAR